MVFKEEVFDVSGLVVVNSPEISCVSRMWWPMVVGYSFYIITELAA